MSKQPIYSYDPILTLDLIKTKPRTFLLLSFLAFKLACRDFSKPDVLDKDEVTFWKYDLDIPLPSHRPMLKYQQLKVAFDNLISWGYISVRTHPLHKQKKIVKILVNPFPTQKEE